MVRSTWHGVILVEEDYYPKGLKYQDRLDDISRAAPLAPRVKIYQQTDKVVIELPDIHPDTCAIVFFRPSDNKLDRTFNPDTGTISKLSFPKDALVKGRYLVKIYWKEGESGYYIEKPFYFN
jgi:hypothetical protein